MSRCGQVIILTQNKSYKLCLGMTLGFTVYTRFPFELSYFSTDFSVGKASIYQLGTQEQSKKNPGLWKTTKLNY